MIHQKSRLLIVSLVAFMTLLLLAACQGQPASQIAFESYRDGNAEVYLMDADGSNLQNLTQDPAYDGTPGWSPDGQRLAFTSERDGMPNIHLMNVDGSEVEQFTSGGGSFNVIPAWSPKDTEIIFVSNRTYDIPGEGGRMEIEANAKLWIAGFDGEDPTRRTKQLGLDMFPSWSPDGESVVFMSLRDDNSEIYLLRPDGVEINLSRNPARDTNPDWSPDGKKVAFMSDRTGDMDIYIMNLEDRSVTNITDHPSADGDPAWSPDGKQIAFISDRDGNTEIYTMDADGSNIKRLTDDPADDIHPQWQPSAP